MSAGDEDLAVRKDKDGVAGWNIGVPRRFTTEFQNTADRAADAEGWIER